jgi:hypothetical protein
MALNLHDKTKNKFLRNVHSGILYRNFISEIVKFCEARTYLEIGTSTGESLVDISCDTISIDPKYNIQKNIVGSKTVLHLFQESSDNFFARRNPKDIFGTAVDVAFLDGMHQFEFLLRDFINVEKYSNPNSIIFMHDCLPVNAEMAERVNSPDMREDAEFATWWTGDVWKIIPILRKWRPDLQIVCLDCPPTGLVAITNLNPENRSLADCYREIMREFLPLSFDDSSFTEFYKTNVVEKSKFLSRIDGFGRYFLPVCNWY